MVDDPILTTEQVAKLLQVHYETARKYIKRGLVPGRKIGRGWRVVESDLRRFISEGHALQQPERKHNL